jgi:hypothetical protein
MNARKINGGLADFIDGETAVKAIDVVGAMADQNGISWAVCGGIAMAIYGSPRLTKDVDIIASKRLPIKEILGYLKQGGEHFTVETEKRMVPIDWILRNDDAKTLFKKALNEAVWIDDLPVVTPEYLVIMKFIAGRFKDQEDAVFLLSQKDLVNREKVKRIIIEVFGSGAWFLAKHGYQRWFDLADSEIEAAKSDLRDS